MCVKSLPGSGNSRLLHSHTPNIVPSYHEKYYNHRPSVYDVSHVHAQSILRNDDDADHLVDDRFLKMPRHYDRWKTRMMRCQASSFLCGNVLELTMEGTRPNSRLVKDLRY